MDSTEMCLRWKDHHHSQAACFKSLLEDNCLVDCTIAAEGQYVKAHKLVLSASSTYFQVLFTQESEKNPIVILKDTKFEDLRALIEFIYCGEVKIHENRVAAFLEIAKSLQIKGLNNIRGRNKAGEISNDTNTDFIEENRCDGSDSSLQNNPASFYEENSCPLQDTSPNQSKGFENSTQNQEYQIAAGNTYPVMHSSESSSIQASTCSSAIQRNQPDTPVASVSDISQQNFTPVEKFSGIVKNNVKMEPPEEMILEPAIDVRSIVKEKLRDLSTDSDIIAMEDEAITKEENAHEDICISFEENSHPPPNNAFMDLQLPTEHSNDQGAPSRPWDAYSATRHPRHGAGSSSPEQLLPAAATAAAAAASATSSGAQWNPLCRLPASPEETARLFRGARPRLRKYVCPHCQKFFLAPSQLEIHIRQHTGERPFHCSVCGAAFNQSGHLTAHMRTHTGEKPYRCDLCGDAFSESSNLTRHKRRHTGERPYPCDECGRRFTTSCQVRVHQRRWHEGGRAAGPGAGAAAAEDAGLPPLHAGAHVN